MPENAKELRHPSEVLCTFGDRIRLYDALGLLLVEKPSALVNPEYIGGGLIALVQDFEACKAEIEAWLAERNGGAR